MSTTSMVARTGAPMACSVNAHASQQVLLSVDGGTAVAAHGGEDERLGADGLDLADEGPHHQGLVGDTPAADAYGNAHARPHWGEHA